MIGKLTYDQINEIIDILSNSNNDLRSILSSYTGDDSISARANKLLNFCNDLDVYIANLNDTVSLNQDADSVVSRLKENSII